MLKKLILSSALCLFCYSATADFIPVPQETLTMDRDMHIDVFQTLRLLQNYHYLPDELNDEFSSRILDKYLDSLDPNKVYFIKSDIDAFEKYRYKLDDSLKKADAEVAFEIFTVLRERIKQRTEYIEKIIDTDFDFSKDEILDIDTEERKWAKNENEISVLWNKRVKNDVLTQVLSDTPIEEIRSNLKRRYQRQYELIHQMQPDDVFETFMNAYTKELEPHTQYMSTITSENFKINMSLSLEGIGAALQTDQDYTVINRIITGGPADMSDALDAEDKIIGVGQEGEDIINVIGWRFMDVVKIIRGEKGSKVTLEILPHDSAPGSPSEKVTLVRDVIQLEEQRAKLSHIELGETDNKQVFSVISIPSFYSNAGQISPASPDYRSTTNDVKNHLIEIKNKNTDGVIIDLRGNGGGFLTEAIDLTGLFIPAGPVVQVRRSNGKNKVHSSHNKQVFYDGPLMVLIDRFSASASEIFSGAIQDYGRGIVVGERSFGKGTVQQVAPLRPQSDAEHKSEIKFTVAQFFRINGHSTQHKGVVPDIILNSGEEDEEFGERSYDNALPWSTITSASYKAQNISGRLTKHLSKQHQKRSIKDPAFIFLRENSESVARNKKMKQLSLNIDKRKQLKQQLEDENLNALNRYRASLNLEPVTEETRKDNPLPDKDEHWEKVFQQEAANIFSDLLHWEQRQKTTVAEAKTN